MDTTKLVSDGKAETSVLGDILNDPTSFFEIRELVDEECFYCGKNNEIWKCINDIVDGGGRPDSITVMQWFMKRPNIGIGPSDIALVLSESDYMHNRQNVLRIRELSTRRKLWKIGMRLITSGTSEYGDDVDSVKQMARDEVESLFSSKQSDIVTLREALGMMNEDIRQQLRMNDTVGTLTGFSCFDMAGGFHPADLIIIAGATSQGKTSFATAITINAIENGCKVAMFSAEMLATQIAARITSMKTDIKSSTIQYTAKYLDGGQLERIDEFMSYHAADNLFIDEKSSTTVDAILVSIRSMKARYDIGGVVIDYMQIIGMKGHDGMSKADLYAESARRFKNIAKELKIWVIVLSQLNRDRQNPEPDMSRILGSNEIAAAADIVSFVYRPKEYGKRFPEPFENVPTDRYAMIDIQKGRNTGVGKRICRFTPEFTKFEDIEPEELDSLTNNNFYVRSNTPSDDPF